MKKLLDERTKTSRGSYNEINLTIVAHKTGGYRLRMSRKLTTLLDLNQDSYIKISIDDDLIQFQKVDSGEDGFYISCTNSTAKIYSKHLVQNLINQFKLKFKSRSSLTFDDSEVLETETGKIVKFVIKGDDE